MVDCNIRLEVLRKKNEEKSQSIKPVSEQGFELRTPQYETAFISIPHIGLLQNQ
jgi:hypothetical protein